MSGRTRVLVVSRTDYRHFRDGDLPVVDRDRHHVAIVTDRRLAPTLRPDDYDELIAVDGLTDDAVRDAARVLHRRARLDRVVSASEADVLLTAGIRDELGVPGMQPATATLFRDKVLMKRAVREHGVRVPDHAEIRTPGDAARFVREHGRSVIKPRAGTGSAATVVVEDPSTAEAWVRDTGDPSAYEVEVFVPAPMYHADGVVADGRVRFVSVSRLLTSTLDFPHGVPLTSATCDDDRIIRAIETVHERVVSALGLRDGATHLEVFADDAGQVTFCEIAGRPGGAAIVPAVMAAYGGYNLMHASVRAQLGVELSPAPPRTSAAGWLLAHPRRGVVTAVSSPEEFAEPWITFRQVSVSEGDRTEMATMSTSAAARFVVTGADQREVERRLDLVGRRFRMVVEDTA